MPENTKSRPARAVKAAPETCTDYYGDQRVYYTG